MQQLTRQLSSFVGNAFISRAHAEPTPGSAVASDMNRHTEHRIISPEELLAQATFLLMTRPEDTVMRLQRLGQNPTLIALFSKPANQQVLDQGSPADIEQLTDFQRLRKDPDMQMLFGRDYLSDRQLATLVSTYWKRNNQLQNNSEVQRLLQDPELKALLDSGSLLALITHPKGRQLINAYLYPPTTSGASSTRPKSSSTATEHQPPSVDTRGGPGSTSGKNPEFASDDIFQTIDDTELGRR
ncbi:hypothetical protein G8770_01640 [Aestuariicella hydrocarbonica]|uniref:Uncharacterized protein n=1 Tax=Pseudomaricurvus hydrocarbonicus TaxID=1470433 RepID=A0A9E5JY60_9GAMM|nr:hypothetical protein [Aestuariicella hydrocarbonica]NHO64247.1 hypothetical protein [Aestuariicella hydrocarbonica]